MVLLAVIPDIATVTGECMHFKPLTLKQLGNFSQDLI